MTTAITVTEHTDETTEAANAVQLRKKSDKIGLELIEASLYGYMVGLERLNQAQVAGSIAIGLALHSAKALIKHGNFSIWRENTFADKLCERTAQVHMKLALAFTKHAATHQLKLPTPSETGMWLTRQSQNKDEAFTAALLSFTGALSYTELLESHHIRTKKEKGGKQVSNYLAYTYVSQEGHEHLLGIEFHLWAEEDKADFEKWCTLERENDHSHLDKEVYTSRWDTLASDLCSQIEKGTYAYLPRVALEDLLGKLKDAVHTIKNAIKDAAI